MYVTKAVNVLVLGSYPWLYTRQTCAMFSVIHCVVAFSETEVPKFCLEERIKHELVNYLRPEERIDWNLEEFIKHEWVNSLRPEERIEASTSQVYESSNLDEWLEAPKILETLKLIF